MKKKLNKNKSQQKKQILPIQQTLGIIKPDACEKNKIGEILAIIEKKGFTLKNITLVKLSKKRAAEFYLVHKKRPFYNQLVNYMSSGTIVAFVAERENAIAKYREVIGDTDPQKAKIGTIRKKFGRDKEKNAIHGSDSVTNARKEIKFFFKK